MTQLSLHQALEFAISHHQAGRTADAESIYRQILAVYPDEPDVHNNLGNLLESTGRIEEAIASCRRAIQLRPDFAEAYDNLGNALRIAGKTDEAIAAYQQALALRPNFPQARNNLGTALFQDKGRFDEAVQEYRAALALAPDFHLARHNLGLILLLNGDYSQGWPLYESRWHLREFQRYRREFPKPRWTGDDLRGRRILLHSEQGFGDTLQFARYIPQVLQRGGRIVLACPVEMLRLMQGVSGIEQFATEGDPLPEFDVHCPLLSLPHLLGTTLDTIPASVPYIHADPALSERWRARIPNDGCLKVGLVWSGRQIPGLARSIQFHQLAPLAKIGNVRFFSLQKGILVTELAPGVPLIDWTSELDDFAETAALLDNLDLLISIDTAAAHLGGAMGKPTWVMLPFVPDWRWMVDRTDSPWYPTMKLLRQKQPGEWKPVIEQAAAMLSALITAR